jgi:hypothetical protein
MIKTEIRMKKIYFISSLAFAIISNSPAQDDLSALTDQALAKTTEYSSGTFFTTRLLTGQSSEIMPKGGLDFRIHHRFDEFKSGFGNFYGLDGSFSYLSLEYGITKFMMAGFGRANDGFFNFFDKIKLLRQSSGEKTMPVTLVYYVECAVDGKTYNNPVKNKDFNRRLNYTHQLIIYRMIDARLSLMIAPTFVHRNMVPSPGYKNDLLAIGVGGRYKIFNTFSINAEYYYVKGIKNLPGGTQNYNPVSIGCDIQVASHVFQIMVTNTSRMLEPSFLGETNGEFSKSLRLGFNISQVFTLGKKKKNESTKN